MGRDRTCGRVWNMAWWPGVTPDVAKYVSVCNACQRVKYGKVQGAIDKTRNPGSTLKRIQVDFVGRITTSVPEGLTYVLAM